MEHVYVSLVCCAQLSVIIQFFVSKYWLSLSVFMVHFNAAMQIQFTHLAHQIQSTVWLALAIDIRTGESMVS